MEEDKKKLLLVAVSVGVVLLIILAIPLMISSIRQSDSYTRQAEVSVGFPTTPIETPAFTQDPEALLRSYGDQPADTIAQQPVEAPDVTTITVPAPRAVAVPDTPVRPAPRTTTARPAGRADAPKETARATADAGKAHNNFWVQTGAFSTKIRAEGVKETLESKGITSIIENREINGKTWYRVRVGPYTSENEANYWLTLVKSIDGFADSQIRQSQSVQ